MTIEELLKLRNQTEAQIEEMDKKIAVAVANRTDKGILLGASVPGTDYYYLIQGAVALEAAHRAILRQIKMSLTRGQYPEAPYGMSLPTV